MSYFELVYIKMYDSWRGTANHDLGRLSRYFRNTRDIERR
jgi:hypothetical protein